MSHPPKTLKPLSAKSRWTLAGYVLLATIMAIICFFPLISELSYRKAHLLSSEAKFQNFRFIYRFNYAFEEFERAIRFFPWETHYAMEYIKELDIFIRQQKSASNKQKLLEKSLSILDYMRHIDPINPWYHSRYSLIYQQLYLITKDAKLLQKSAYHTQQAAISDYENPIFLLNYAHLLHGNNRLSEAFHYYKKSLNTDARFAEAHFNLSDIYISLNKPKFALNHYLKAKALKPSFEGLDNRIIKLYTSLKEYKKAQAYIHEYSLYSSKDPLTLESIARLYLEQKKYETALSFLTPIFKLPRFSNQAAPQHIYKLYIESLLANQQQSFAKEFLIKERKRFPKVTYLKSLMSLI